MGRTCCNCFEKKYFEVVVEPNLDLSCAITLQII